MPPFFYVRIAPTSYGAEMAEGNEHQRFSLLSKRKSEQDSSFAASVRAGLTAHPRSLPCRFLYDALGGRLFQAICELPEYYVTRLEREILTGAASEIVASQPPYTTLVELGSGNSDKSRILIGAMLEKNVHLRYVPIDVSREALKESGQQLTMRYPTLDVVAICAEYLDGLRELDSIADHPCLIAWLGTSIGNLERSEAAEFLRKLKPKLAPDDRVLIGIDLRKKPDLLELAYDDPLGVTAAFNLNLLGRINRELGGNFDLTNFAHSARYIEDLGRIEMHIVSKSDQQVSVPAIELDVTFRAGEMIHTENSYKYSLAEVDSLAKDAGYKIQAQRCADHQWFALNLLEPTTPM